MLPSSHERLVPASYMCAGKTSLIMAMLGQMNRLKGEQSLRGRVSYVSQDTWIQNLSLQDNVLFDLPMDEEEYADVMDAVQLSQDLLTLPSADLTEIGERGINLSGGQKTRVSCGKNVLLHFLLCV